MHVYLLMDLLMVSYTMEFEIWIGVDEKTLTEYRQTAATKLGTRGKTKHEDVNLVSEEDEEDETVR